MSFGVGGIRRVEISYDPEKRAATLERRGLDFEDAVHVFAGATYQAVDDRQDYGEQRWQTYGMLRRRLVTIVWTERGNVCHIIFMRKCNDRGKARFG